MVALAVLCLGRIQRSSWHSSGLHIPWLKWVADFGRSSPLWLHLLWLLFQFCDMVSAPEMNCWAGPIIDVLLDYVGNVQLCSRLKEHIDSYEEWAVIKEKAGMMLVWIILPRTESKPGNHTTGWVNDIESLSLPEAISVHKQNTV